MDLELDDVVEDAFGFGVEFFTQGVGAERELFVSVGCVREGLVRGRREGGTLLNVCVHLSLLHQLNAFRQSGPHLGQFFFHLFDLRVRCEFLGRCYL